MASITLYTTKTCPYCWRAKALLDRRGLPYTEVDLTTDHAERERLVERTGHRTVPLIFIGDRFIGGSDELYELDRRGELKTA